MEKNLKENIYILFIINIYNEPFCCAPESNTHCKWTILQFLKNANNFKTLPYGKVAYFSFCSPTP